MKKKKDAIIKWCPQQNPESSDRKGPNKGEGVLTAAAKTLRPGSMDGETSALNIGESSLHRYFYKRRLNWFYRIDESVPIILARRLAIEMGRRRAAGDKRPMKAIYKDVIKTFSGKLKKSEDGPLLPVKKKKQSFWKNLFEDVNHDLFSEFTEFAVQYLDLKKPPKITYVDQMEGRNTFACWSNEGITLAYKNRHPMDVFRSLAHELVHHKQHEMDVLHSESGKTGSEHENEANAVAGIIMRDFAKIRPEYFELESLNEAKVGVKFPRQSKSMPSRNYKGSSSRTRTPKFSTRGLKKVWKTLTGSPKKKTAKARKPVTQKKVAAPKKTKTPKQQPHTNVEQKSNTSKKIDTGLQQTIQKKIELIDKLVSTHSKIPKNATITTKNGVMNRRSFYWQSIQHHRGELNRLASENGVTLNKNDFKKPDAPKTMKQSPYAVKPAASAGSPGEKGKFTTFHGVSQKPKSSGSGRTITPKKPPVVAENIGFRETLALMKKSERSKIPFEVLKEVFNRGFHSRDYPHLTREQAAFNRVNSFVAGGAAREIDNDLLEEDNG